MALPLLLAGPILRRVEPTLVCVWVALSESATLKLTLWEGRVNAGSANAHVESAPEHQDLRRIGEHLFVGVVRLKLDAASPKKLQPGRSYSYDLTITPSGSTAQTLASLGLLATGVREGKRVEALGFEDGLLPSFALPPEQITDLRVVFGSCRRVANDHLDAFVYIDDLMRDAAYSVADPLKRPHQLFLGGDQIYADDVSPAQMAMIIALARELIGSDATGGSRERLPVDHIRRAGVPAPAGFDDYGPDVARGSAGSDPAEFLLPADAAHFPPGRRYLLSTVDAQMTSIDGRSHLFALGEFAAMYLMVWSNAVWPAALPDAAALITPAWPADRIATFVDAPFDAAETRGVGEAQSPFNTYTAFKTAAEEGGGTVEQALARHATQLTTFERGLAKVRRVLANVPTYMIFDDHDLTDDWNLNPIWYDRVMATSLGTATLRNGLVAYALFQDWGNDPERYRVADGEPKKLLDQAVALFAGSATPGPAAAAANEIDKLLGLNLRGRRNVDGSRGRRRAAAEVALLGARPEASGGGFRQPHAAQLRLGQRAAGQRGEGRARRAGARRAAGRRQGGAARRGTASGAGATAAGRSGGTGGLQGVRHGRAHLQRPCRSRPQRRQPRHDRHQSGCDRGLGVRCADDGSAARAPGRAQAGRLAVRRRALLRQRRDELLHQGPGRPGAPRAVHLQRHEERDAELPHRPSTAA